MRNARLDEAQTGLKISRRNINYPRYADDTTLLAESKEDLKSILKTWFKIQHSINEDHETQSHHFMANRWRNNANSDRLYFGGVPKSL